MLGIGLVAIVDGWVAPECRRVGAAGLLAEPVGLRTRACRHLLDCLPGCGQPVPAAAGRTRTVAGATIPRCGAVPAEPEPLLPPVFGSAARHRAWLGAVLSVGIVVGLVDAAPLLLWMLIWLVLWALYLSIVNIGQTFYAFGWESLLLEAGFFAIFLGPAWMAPPVVVIWMIRWLLFRVEFGAGLIKIRGDPGWRDLTCLYYHHETQPMPNPLSWYFHHLPKPLHKVEVLGNFFAQLVVPFGLFAPQPIASIAGAILVVTQSWLLVSGNFAWLNALTLTLA